METSEIEPYLYVLYGNLLFVRKGIKNQQRTELLEIQDGGVGKHCVLLSMNTLKLQLNWRRPHNIWL